MLKRKDLLGIKDLSGEEINLILNTAAEMKKILKQNVKKVPHLQNKSVVTLFYENSTRTRMSFEVAAKFMSASVSNITVASSSIQKGETLVDTGKTLDALMSDIIIIRHGVAGAPHLLARNVKAGVINAGDGMNEHPSQALLDMFTMKEKFGNLKGLTVGIYGDIMHSRVARSNIWGLTKAGAVVKVFGPETLMPAEIEKTGIEKVNSMEEIVKDSDVLMGLRIQLERQKSALFPDVKEYSQYFGLNRKLLEIAKKDVIIMHPGPVNRGVEITSEVIDSQGSVIQEQVTNGIAVRMALLFLLTRGNRNENID
jgi:aspartate carbamoyltransferase catalytic subunit